jgi:hypothetical protein
VRTGDKLKRWYGSEAEQWIADRVGSGAGKDSVAVADEIADDHMFADDKGVASRWFRVHWKGFGPNDDTWKVGGQIKNLKCFEAYITMKRNEGHDWARDTRLTGERLSKSVRKKVTAGVVRGTRRRELPPVEGEPLSVLPVELDDSETRLVTEDRELRGGQTTESQLETEAGRRAVAEAECQGREFDHSGEHFPGGKVIDAGGVLRLEKGGVMRYQQEGDPFCYNCEDGGILVQCDYCTRAFHVRCSGRNALPMEEEIWLCAWCSHAAWSKGLLDESQASD